MIYDPKSFEHRKLLASNLSNTLIEKGFSDSNNKSSGRESEFDFKSPNRKGFLIKVYSSIVNGVAREEGEDAIRVILMWVSKDGKMTPISKSSRVNRTGEIEKIVERTLERGRGLWKEISELEVCSCGAPKILSKKNKLYCVDRCWINK